MKLEDQVCSLELSKRLKELGLPQFSLWSYNSKNVLCLYTFLAKEKDQYVSAFTASELSNLLPVSIQSEELTSFLKIYKSHQIDCNAIDWIVSYECVGGIIYPWNFGERTLVDAFAKMLIHLIETGVVK